MFGMVILALLFPYLYTPIRVCCILDSGALVASFNDFLFIQRIFMILPACISSFHLVLPLVPYLAGHSVKCLQLSICVQVFQDLLQLLQVFCCHLMLWVFIFCLSKRMLLTGSRGRCSTG